MSAETQRDGEFAIERLPMDGGVRLRLVGELDIATADRLEREFADESVSGASKLAVDIGALNFMDSTGLRLLIAAARRAEDAGREFVLVTGDSPARRVLEVTRIDEHMNVVEQL